MITLTSYDLCSQIKSNNFRRQQIKIFTIVIEKSSKIKRIQSRSKTTFTKSTILKYFKYLKKIRIVKMVNDFDTSAECRLAEMRSHRNDVDEQMNMVNISKV